MDDRAADSAGDRHGELAYLSLGSNIGEREVAIRRALQAIGATPRAVLLRVSSMYETDPVGYLEQPQFINCAAVVRTSLDPETLLARLHEIEQELGRVRRMKWRQREIDIDIVLFDALTVVREHLTIPHPEMHQRRFVLAPLAEIAPEAVHPVLGATVRELLERCDDPAGVRIVQSDNPQPDDRIWQ